MLHVGLSAWIIQDGNYGEFETGQEYRFAIEFYPHEIAADSHAHSVPRLSHLGNAVYDARGAVLFSSDSAWVVDFGIPAYQEATPPAWAKVATRVSGRVYIGVDPFFYFERLKNETGMPSLSRQWLIRRILLEKTPWNESVGPQGQKVFSRDATRVDFEEVPATDAWNHDGGHGHYVLECELRPGPAV